MLTPTGQDTIAAKKLNILFSDLLTMDEGSKWMPEDGTAFADCRAWRDSRFAAGLGCANEAKRPYSLFLCCWSQGLLL